MDILYVDDFPDTETTVIQLGLHHVEFNKDPIASNKNFMILWEHHNDLVRAFNELTAKLENLE